MVVLRAAAFVVLVFCGWVSIGLGAAALADARKPQGPALSLHILGHGTQRHVIGMVPMQLTVWARLYDPRREFECPSFEWEYGDGDRSSRENLSCDPFSSTQPTEYRTDPMRHTYRMGGEHRLKVTVRAGKRERSEYRDVTAIGPSLEDFR